MGEHSTVRFMCTHTHTYEIHNLMIIIICIASLIFFIRSFSVFRVRFVSTRFHLKFLLGMYKLYSFYAVANMKNVMKENYIYSAAWWNLSRWICYSLFIVYFKARDGKFTDEPILINLNWTNLEQIFWFKLPFASNLNKEKNPNS